MPFSLRLALRYLFSPNKGSFSSFASWLAIGGLSIGITALMLTASIIHGFQSAISEKLSSFEGQGRIQHILGQPLDLTAPKLDSLVHSQKGNVSPYIRGVCMARSGNHADGMLVEGVESLPRAIDPNRSTLIQQGTIIIGRGLAQELHVVVGDEIYLQVFSTQSSTKRRIKSLRVEKIYQSGLQEYDKTLAYVHIEDAKHIFGVTGNQVSGLIVHGNAPEFLGSLSYPHFFETWKDRHALLFEWIKLQRWPAYIMFGLIAMVGIVNIIAAIAMIILEKSGQIGILMAQGTPRSALKHIFMIQGGFIGLLGGLIGGGLSMMIIWAQLKFEILKIPSEIYFMDQIPFSFDFPVFGLILAITFIFCMLASWWPTKSVTTLNPATALRYE